MATLGRRRRPMIGKAAGSWAWQVVEAAGGSHGRAVTAGEGRASEWVSSGGIKPLAMRLLPCSVVQMSSLLAGWARCGAVGTGRACHGSCVWRWPWGQAAAKQITEHRRTTHSKEQDRSIVRCSSVNFDSLMF
ncbi:hypothetical protein ABZP36_021343 [Zizania latifolia]